MTALNFRTPEADGVLMEAGAPTVRRVISITAAFILIVAVLGAVPANAADDPEIVAAGRVYGGMYSDIWEIDDDLDAMAAATGKRVTFAGTFHNVFENDGVSTPGWSNTKAILDRAWAGKATPVANVGLDVAAYRIARGDYDAKIAEWAGHVKQFLDQGGGRSLIIAPLQEMNGNWTPWSCDSGNYPGAFRRFVDIFRGMGIDETEVRWAFAPNGWTSPGCGSIADYYPGDGHVDVIAISAYNFGYCSGGNGWESPQQAFGPWLNELRTTVNAFKPYLIVQTAAPRSAGCGGPQDQWVRDMQTYLVNDPNVIGFVWFNFDLWYETNWKVWQGGSATQGWRDAMQRSSTKYQWPLTDWFQPGTLTVGIPSGPGDKVTVIGGPGAVSDAVRFQIVGSIGGLPSRVSGVNRYDTAAKLSAANFSPGVSAVFIATGESFPDALAMGPAAASVGAPLLLVSGNGIPGHTAAELQRLNPASIVIGGGYGAVSASVEQQLESYTAGPVTRIAGANRYATAANISAAYFPSGADTVYVTTGANFPDALSAGAAAAAGGPEPVPVLLANGSGLPGEVTAELTRLSPNRVVIVGGTSVVSPAVEAQIQGLGIPDVDRLAGNNRYSTSAAVSASVFSSGQSAVLLATGENYPDALAAVALAGKLGTPLLLTRTDDLPAVIQNELSRLLS